MIPGIVKLWESPSRAGGLLLINYPHHVVQRGHNKQVVFAEEDDYRYFLCTLEEYKDLYDVKVFGSCLMTNHVHLILQLGRDYFWSWATDEEVGG